MPPENRRRRPPLTPKDPDAGLTPAERQVRQRERLRALPLAQTSLGVRVINTLEEHDIILLGQLLLQPYDVLIKMPNFGTKTMSEVRAAARKLGIEPPKIWAKPKTKPRAPKDRGQMLGL